MVIRHGEKVMCEVEDEDGQKRPMTVVEFIQYSLADDELTMRSPLHRRILEEALEHFGETGFRCDRYFENHPDFEIASLANDLGHDPVTLSKIHTKDTTLKPEEERLVDLLPHLMTDYKLAIVDERMHAVMLQMKDPAVLADKERSIELMKQYQDIKQIQTILGRERGDRVIG